MPNAHPLRAAVEGEDWPAVEALLHPDVQFRSPAVFAAYAGRTACLHLLHMVKEVFEGFHYIDELSGRSADGPTTGLVFRASVDGKDLEGWDYLTHDHDGLITQFVVMVRPLSGLIALAQAMGARLEAAPVPTD
ncbi:MAG TPA: hypothetical protein VMM13_19575 [Euzebya sp.]|nr:hypothetical protein [Euzebya sp.]